MAYVAEADRDVRLGTVDDVATITGLSRSHINRLRLYRPEDSPPHLRMGHRVLYPLNGPRGLSAWIEQRTIAGSAR